MEDRNLKGHAYMLLAYMIFGLNIPVTKDVLIHENILPDALTFYRFAGTTALFWLLSLFTRWEKVGARDLATIFCASLFGIFINQYAFIVGLVHTSPINASVIVATSPVVTMLLAALFMKEPVTGIKMLGILIGAAGALLIVFTGNTAEQRAASAGGNALCALSCLSFAVYLTAFKRIIAKYSPATLMKWMFLFGTLCGLPFCWKSVAAVNCLQFPAGVYLRLFYIIALASFVAYLVIPIGQKTLRPTIVSMYSYLQPVVAALAAVALGMDEFDWTKGCATALVFAGVYVVTKSKSRAQIERGQSPKSQ